MNELSYQEGEHMGRCIGILTAGGDSPGLNAAIRAVGRALAQKDIYLLGFKDGFEGLAFDKCEYLDNSTFSGILTRGGTILGTSRHKPHKMPVGKKFIDMTDAIVENYHKHQLEGLICLGGGGTHKSALRLMKEGLNVITMPKTIDNDLAETDTSIGFDTATDIATHAIDSLHSTASSHNRIILVEVMGHRAGWLTLYSGIAGGADVILIPEVPYNIKCVAEAILRRNREGKKFSIVPVAEGAMSIDMAAKFDKLHKQKAEAKDKDAAEKISEKLAELDRLNSGTTLRISQQLEKMTGLESRVTILGHLQRGGIPSAADRLLATRLGVECAQSIIEGKFGVMMSARGGNVVPVPIEDVAGKIKLVPTDDILVNAARNSGISFGDC